MIYWVDSSFKFKKMKLPLILIALLYSITFHSFSQIPGYREDTAFPTFDLNFLIIKSSQEPSK